MAYIEIKTIKGRKYKYLRRSVRMEGKMKKVTLKYLGPVDPIHRVGKKRKTNASIYVRNLIKEEREELNKATHSSNAFVRDRAKIVLLSAEKMYAQQIAEKIGCEVRKVRNAVKVFNQEGLKYFERKKAKGATPKFTEFDRKAILIHFYREPREFGYHYTTWTLPRFRKHLMDNRVVESISIGTIRNIIKTNGAKLKKSKRWQYSPDKEFYKKNVK